MFFRSLSPIIDKTVTMFAFVYVFVGRGSLYPRPRLLLLYSKVASISQDPSVNQTNKRPIIITTLIEDTLTYTKLIEKEFRRGVSSAAK